MRRQRLLLLLLELAHERELLGRRLEATVAELGRGVDELERHRLACPAVSLREARLTEGKHPLLAAHGRALEHDKVLLDLTVVRETTHRGNALLGRVSLGRTVEVRRLALNLRAAATKR